MKKTVSLQDFREDFKNYGRGNQFSYDGLCALFEYLLEYEQNTETEIELDVIGLCCDYCEYKNLEEFQEDYSKNFKDIECIKENTVFIKVGESSFIIKQF